MNIKGIIKTGESFLTKNSPAILTGIGVVGVITTAYLTHKAAVKSVDVIENDFRAVNAGNRPEFGDEDVYRTPKEKFDLTWKLYIPPVISASVTIASIICANKIGTRRTAAMAAALTLSERAYDEYASKVTEVVGEKKAKKIKDAVSQDRVTNHPPTGTYDASKTLCLDEYSGRYFGCDMETLRRAENQVNKRLFTDDEISLTTFYGLIGLKPTSISDDVGWRVDKLLDLHIASALTPEDVPGVEPNRPVLSFSYQTIPLKDPWRFRS